MRLAVLSRTPRSYSMQRLRHAANDRGHDIDVLNTLRLSIDVSGAEPTMLYRGRPIEEYDAVLPRIGASITFYGSAVIRQFEQMDVYTPVTANGLANSRDKLRSIQLLSSHGIGIPDTAFIRNRSDVRAAIERVGGAPVIIKLLEGTQGIGVILAPDVEVAEAVIETLQFTKQNVLIQRFIAESKGRDIRAFVVGDQVVAAMRRVSSSNDFRSNVHRGGRTEPIELDPKARRLALRAAHIMGLQIAGVDMLESDDGPLVMEVNSSPGFEGIEAATNLDVAGAVIDYIASQVDYPSLDVRERLATATGYGMAELYVGEGSELAGHTIADGLNDLDVRVLTLHRGDEVVPNPNLDRTLELDDRLLCFGRLSQMRKLIPARRRRRSRPSVQPLAPEELMIPAGGDTGAGHEVGAAAGS